MKIHDFVKDTKMMEQNERRAIEARERYNKKAEVQHENTHEPENTDNPTKETYSKEKKKKAGHTSSK